MAAYDYYYSLGDFYFKMATDKGFHGILPAVKKAFHIAGINIKQVIDVANKDSSAYQDYLGKFNKTMNFAESV